MAKLSTATGGIVTYDDGKFQLQVLYYCTKDAINFFPYVIVGNAKSDKDGFAHDHTAMFEWRTPDNKLVPQKHTNVREKGLYYASSKWQDTSSKKKVKQEYIGRKQSSPGNKAKVTGKHKKKKEKANAKVKKRVYTVKERIDSYQNASVAKAKFEKGELKIPWYTNKDHSVTISVYMSVATNLNKYDKKAGKYPKVVSAKSTVTIYNTLDPAPPEAISASLGSSSHTDKIQITVKNVTGTPNIPVKSLSIERMSESYTSGESWAPVTSMTKTWFSSNSGRGLEKKETVYFKDDTADYGLQPGNRYKYKAIVKGLKVGNTQPSSSKQTGWYYTSPPAPSNVDHRRISDSTNRILFTRDHRAIILNFIKGFVIEYNTLEPSDSGFDQNWKVLPSFKELSDAKKTKIIKDPVTGKDKEVVPDDIEYWGSVDLYTGNNTGDYVMSEEYDDVAINHYHCSKDTRYSYRISSYNFFTGSSTKGYSAPSSLDGTAQTYNTPNAPADLKAIPDFERNIIKVTITKTATSTADKLFLQRKIDDGEWTDIDEDGIDISIYDQKKVEFDYEDGDIIEYMGKDITYRAALGCSKTLSDGRIIENHGKSGYSKEVQVKLLSKPNKPNLIMPIDKTTISILGESVRLGWVHSPKDGTEQKNFKIEYKIGNNDSWTLIEGTTDAYYDLPLHSGSVVFLPNDVITWRVCTKGAHADYSDWSSEKTFTLLSPPTISITSHNNKDVVSYLPLTLTWQYSDLSGTLEKLRLDISLEEGIPVDTFDIDVQSLGGLSQYTIDDYLFDDETTYTFKLTAVSTSKLSTETEVSVDILYVNMNLTNGFALEASFDENTGYSNISIGKVLPINTEENHNNATDEETEEMISDAGLSDTPLPEDTVTERTSSARVKKIYVYRVYEAERDLVAELDIDLNNYEAIDTLSVVDLYAPINRPFEYKLLQLTELGEVSVDSGHVYTFNTLWWYIYWGDDEVIKTKWNPSGSGSLDRPDMQEVRYSGREYPVIYDSSAREESYSYSFILIRSDRMYEMDEDDDGDSFDDGEVTLSQFKAMMRTGGVGIWKSFEGDVYPAKFSFTYSSNYTEGLPMWNCSLNITRVEGDDF